MCLLFRVLRAWKARGTHHKLALDALPLLTCANAERWQHVCLLHIEPFLAGAKAPDDQFKDFRNHVYHVREGGWGGAPGAAIAWYAKTVVAAQARRWSEFAFNAGVLSHYLTDPAMPFHTGQSEAEGAVHRAIEWSANKAFEELLTILQTDLGGYPDWPLPDSEHWLEDTVHAVATEANPHYDVLIDHYDLKRGVKDPIAGLDQELKDRLARQIGLATVVVARVLSRAVDEAGVTPPVVPVSLLGVLAQLTVPIFFVTQQLQSESDRKLVAAMYREYQQTGKVVENLPADDREVRRLHAEEVRQIPLEDLDREPARPVGQQHGTGAEARVAPRPKPAVAAPGARGKAPRPSGRPPLEQTSRTLGLEDDVERAPGIGAKTARHLKKLGIQTVGQFLDQIPETLSQKLGQRWLTADVLRQWQWQTRLMCDVPDLRAIDSELLVTLMLRTTSDIAQQDPTVLHQRLSELAATKEGQQILRRCAAPTLAEVTAWHTAAIDRLTRPSAA